MQADFVLLLRSVVGHTRWWPNTLVYATHLIDYPFEIFARSQSSAYFNRVKIAVGVANKAELEAVISDMTSGSVKVPTWQGDSFSPPVLAIIQHIATKP